MNEINQQTRIVDERHLYPQPSISSLLFGTVFSQDLSMGPQRKQFILETQDARDVALSNECQQFRIMLDELAQDMIVDRHQVNGALFDTYFEKPRFTESVLEYLGDAHAEIRSEHAQ